MMKCPSCKTETFITKDYEGVEIDQCKACHGIWLDKNEIGQIVESTLVQFKPEDIKSTVYNAFSGIPKTELEKEARLCPKCDSPMEAINYVADSGIILDRCSNDHGVWLDQFELEQVQQYREYWDQNKDKSAEYFSNLIKDVSGEPQEKSSKAFFFELSKLVGSQLFK